MCEKVDTGSVINWSQMYKKVMKVPSYCKSIYSYFMGNMAVVHKWCVILGFGYGFVTGFDRALQICNNKNILSCGTLSNYCIVPCHASYMFTIKRYFILTESLFHGLMGAIFGGAFPFNIIAILYCMFK